MGLPTDLLITCYLDNQPVAGLLVYITFHTNYRNDVVVIEGPSGLDGVITCDWADIAQQEAQDTQLFIDAGRLSDFNGSITVQPLNRTDVDEALHAYETFKRVTRYPRNHRNLLVEARQLLEINAGAVVPVKAEYRPAGLHVVTKSTCA